LCALLGPVLDFGSISEATDVQCRDLAAQRRVLHDMYCSSWQFCACVLHFLPQSGILCALLGPVPILGAPARFCARAVHTSTFSRTVRPANLLASQECGTLVTQGHARKPRYLRAKLTFGRNLHKCELTDSQNSDGVSSPGHSICALQGKNQRVLSTSHRETNYGPTGSLLDASK
jgi:hypothetical protein